ncbi:MAG TPA: VWA domain-containing protein [Polyangiaceae bacterium]|nr:VWA domain-containing protein [Polyangiaceae bacterium]
MSPRRNHSSASSFGLLVCLVAATTMAACSSSDDKSKGSNSGAGTSGFDGTAGQGAKGGSNGTGGSGVDILAKGGSAGATGATTSGCGETALAATRRPVNVLILLDRSLSMTNPMSGTESTTRWVAMRNALNAALTPVSDRISFGLKFFPDGDATAAQECAVLGSSADVALGLGSTNVQAVDLAIAQATPNGGTPIGTALEWAKTYFETGPGSASVGDRVVLLATDGAPNCNPQITCDASSCISNIDHPEQPGNLCESFPTKCLDGANAQAKVQTLLTLPVPVRTVVVGIPGSDNPAYAAVLDQLGKSGGLPNPDATLDYFAVTPEQGAAGLSATLVQITSKLIVTCKLELTSVPPDPALLNVYVDGTIVPKNATDGWKLDMTTTPPTVLLQGTTCAKLETSGAQSISIKYGCPTYVLL